MSFESPVLMELVILLLYNTTRRGKLFKGFSSSPPLAIPGLAAGFYPPMGLQGRFPRFPLLDLGLAEPITWFPYLIGVPRRCGRGNARFSSITPRPWLLPGAPSHQIYLGGCPSVGNPFPLMARHPPLALPCSGNLPPVTGLLDTRPGHPPGSFLVCACMLMYTHKYVHINTQIH